MKAYYLSIKDEEDAGGEIVFANTAKEAKKQAYGSDFAANAESYIYIRVHRDKRYDGMENLSRAALALHQWKDGWRWFDTEYPDPYDATDAEFIEWYNRNFEITVPPEGGNS